MHGMVVLLVESSSQGRVHSSLIPKSTFSKVVCPGVVGIGVGTRSGSARHSSSTDLGSVGFNSSLPLCQFLWNAREGKEERAGGDHVLLHTSPAGARSKA